MMIWDLEEFVSELFPGIGDSDEIPDTIILTPTNKVTKFRL